MDAIAFITSATGGIILLALGVFLWMVMGKGTGKKAGKYSMVGKILAFAGALILIIPMVGGIDEGVKPGETTPAIKSDYDILFVVDASTAVISADFSQTDEAAAGEYSVNKEARTITLTNACTWDSSACTWDAYSFTMTISRQDSSAWVDGARVTTSLGARVEPSLLTWGIVSNNTGGNPIITMVDTDSQAQSGFIWVDGAAANKKSS